MIYVNNWQSLRKKSTSLLLCIALSFQFVGTSFVSAASSILGTTGTNPRGIAIDSAGNIYTANLGSDNVTKITPAGVSTILGTTGTLPHGITIDSAGNIYTANSSSNNVTKITPAGVSTILGTTGTNPWGITIDSAGNIYTANLGSDNVTKITPAGVSTILGTTGTNPRGITVDTAGNIYTANSSSNNVTKITPAGVSTILGTTGTMPHGITIDSAGNIYTANLGSDNVTKITPAGVSTILGTTGTNPWGITIDSAGNIYTANLGSDNVTKITPAGVSTILGTTGAIPYGITVDTAGNIYTANSSSNNVTKIGNSAPTDITLSGTTVADGAIAPIIVGTLSTTDPDVGDTHTYFLNGCTIPGVDDLLFSRSGSELSLNTTPSFVTQSSYNICIRTVDAGGLTYDKNFVINVVDTTPPTVPTCTASPSTTSGATTVTCTGTESGATLTIPGLTCSPTPANTTGTVSCTGTILTSNPTLTIADPSGNTATGTVTVTLDTTPPTVPTCTASPSTTSGATTVTCTGTESGATLTIPGLTCSPTPADATGTVSCTGSILTSNPTLTIADPSGNTATGTVTVTLDTTPPTVPTCTASPSTTSGATTVTCTGTESGATLTIPGLSCSPTPADATGAVLCTGNILTSNPVVTIADTSGNTATGTVTATLDTTAPVLTLSGSSTITVVKNTSYTDAGATCTDNVDTTCTVTSSGTVNTTIPGTYTITYTAVDTAGNISTTTRTVTVVLGDIPVITLSGSTPVTVELGSVYTDAGATALDTEDGNITASIVTSNTVNTGLVGTYTVTYNVTDSSGNTGATVTRTVNVVDTTPPLTPIILTPGSGSILKDNTPTFSGTGEVGTTITLVVGGQTLTGTVDASGNWNITPTTPLSDGLHTVTVTLTDTSGNMSPILSRPFTVDTTPPVLTLIGSGTISLPFGGTYTEYGARWTDAIDGSGTLLTATSGSVNPNIAGTYTLTYRYTDTAGNTTTITRTVTIGQPVGPGGGGGGGGSYSPSVPVTPSQPSSTDTVVPPTTIPPEYQIQLLPTQSQVIPSGLNTDGQLIYTLKSPLTDYICPQIVQVYSEDELKAQDISASSLFSDDIKSVIMFRGLEKDEQMNGQTFEEYKKFGIAINDTSFEPTRNVTRAEYVKMLVRALSCRYQKEGTNTPFSDVAESMWYAEYINFATNHGWINGYEDGTFRPDAPITRAEAAKILANAIQLETQTSGTVQSSFSDVPDNSVFTPYIEALKENKVISGRTKTTYVPDAYIPRTEVSRIIYKTFLGGQPK